jgi:hypothetical protein
MLLDIARYLGPPTVRNDLARQLNELEDEQLDHEQYTRERTNDKFLRANGKGNGPSSRRLDEPSEDGKTAFGGYMHTQQAKVANR